MAHTVSPTRHVVAFAGQRLVGEGEVASVVPQLLSARGADPHAPLLLFDAVTSEPIDLDLRGSADDVVARLGAPSAAGGPRLPGRPRLGVVAREVTLLPRHWDWLAIQPGGASAALRRLVDAARAEHADRDRRRAAQEAAYRFLSAMLGDAPGFEDAIRALFAGDAARFAAHSERWPAGPRDHARRLAAVAFAAPAHEAAPTPAA